MYKIVPLITPKRSNVEVANPTRLLNNHSGIAHHPTVISIHIT